MIKTIEINEISRRLDARTEEELWNYLKDILNKKFLIRNLILSKVDLNDVVDWLEMVEKEN